MNMFRYLVLILFALIHTTIIGQKYNVYGSVKDAVSGETLVGSALMVQPVNYITTSNNYGFFTFNIEAGSYTVTCSYIGYEQYSSKITVKKDSVFNINLMPTTINLQEITVNNGKTILDDIPTSKTNLNLSLIKLLPTVSGEPDILKAIQLLPGVQTANEGTSNLYVRGGNHDQNLILLDEAPVYNASHTLGFFSIFNTNAIKNVTLYKGAFPAQYGGRLSSVVDIQMKEGNYNKTKVDIGIGTLASRVGIEGPIIKDKASFMITGRYCYAGQTLNLLGGKIGSDLLNLKPLNNFNDKNEISFYDLNVKFNYKLNKMNHLYVSTYNGKDHFYSYPLNNDNELNWGNLTSTVRWNHIYSGKLFSNTTAYFSNYNYNSTIREDIKNYTWKANIQELGLKHDISYYPNSNNKINVGMEGKLLDIEPGEMSAKDTSYIINSFSLGKKEATALALYVNNDQRISNVISLNYGLRYTVFINNNINSEMQDVPNTYLFNDFEPRLSAKLKLNEVNAIKVGYGRTVQYLHLLSNSTVGLPTDVWIPSDENIKPQYADQYILGYYRILKHNLNLTLETYYKQLYDIIDYKDNADIFMNENVYTEMLIGNGRSVGVELLIEKTQGVTTGWIGYTLAKTQYKIDGINNGEFYSPRYDIRHNFTVVGNHILNKKWTFSTTFKLTSGGFVTLPTQAFIVDNAAFFYYPKRNNYALPLYHRLDIAFKYRSTKNDTREKYKSHWIFAVNNVYGKKNIFSLYAQQDPIDFSNSHTYSMYLYSIVPTLTYNISF